MKTAPFFWGLQKYENFNMKYLNMDCFFVIDIFPILPSVYGVFIFFLMMGLLVIQSSSVVHDAGELSGEAKWVSVSAIRASKL